MAHFVRLTTVASVVFGLKCDSIIAHYDCKVLIELATNNVYFEQSPSFARHLRASSKILLSH